MPNYQNAKIYVIWSPSTDLMYIGSTTQKLCSRLSGHKRNYKSYKNGKYHNVTSFQILEYEDARIELITECPCENREQLRQIEAGFIRDLDCVNKCIPGRTKKQHYQDNKEKIKKHNKHYYQDNREKFLEQAKIYHQDNREKIIKYKKQKYQDNREKFLEQNKNYYQANKQKILEQVKIYRQNNKEKIKDREKKYYQNNKQKILEKQNEKFDCECGSRYTYSNKARHERTIKHKKYMENL